MLCALGVVMLFLGGMLGDMDLTVAAFASLIVLMAVIEMGIKTGVMVYAVTSLLALILFPAYFITPMYICFVGFYPLLKYFAEKQRKPVAFLIKFFALNAMLAVILLFAYYVYGINVISMEIGSLQLGKITIVIIYLLANAALFLFDFCLTKLIILYNLKIRNILKIYKLFR